MAHPGAQRGSSPEEKGLLGGEEGTPPAEVAWSQSSRATTSRGRGVLPVDSREPLQMPVGIKEADFFPGFIIVSHHNLVLNHFNHSIFQYILQNDLLSLWLPQIPLSLYLKFLSSILKPLKFKSIFIPSVLGLHFESVLPMPTLS